MSRANLDRLREENFKLTVELEGERYGVVANAPVSAFATTGAIEKFANSVATMVATTIMSHYAATLSEDVVD